MSFPPATPDRTTHGWRHDIPGHTALVTGASRGIGRAIAVGLAKAGADILGLSRSPKELATLGQEVERLGRQFRPLAVDLKDVSAIASMVEEAWGWRGRIDVLINAAGIIIRTNPPDVEPEDWDLLMAVNLRAPFFLSQEIGRRMVAAQGGSIVNIASLAGEVVTGAPLAYQASKAALIHLTRGLAATFGPFVRVNAVGPGYIRTSLNEDWLNHEANTRYVEEHTSLKRVGAPEDIVGAVVFLASPAAAYITGQHLRVDGGWSA